jgi:hypothetical protein
MNRVITFGYFFLSFSPSRIDEFSWEFSMLRSEVNYLFTDAERELSAIFDNATVSEWLEQKIYPMSKELSDLDAFTKSVASADQWPRRPLPPDPGFAALANSLAPPKQAAPALAALRRSDVSVDEEPVGEVGDDAKVQRSGV